MQRICICAVQVPFVRGGAELLVDSLQGALQERGYQAEVVTLPFQWQPARAVLSSALAWRLLDLTHSQGRAIDLVIATKFPAYLVRHPQKVTWLFHQFRQAYDLHGTRYGELDEDAEGQRVLPLVRRMDNAILPESRSIFTIARNVSKRLQEFNGIPSTPLYPPPPLDDRYYCEAYGDFILSTGRLDGIKRVDLLLRALKQARGPVRCIITGVGPDASRLAALTRELGLEQQVTFPGFVPEAELLELYARCRAVYNAPYDEDYGFVTLEAFRAQKPVLTASDAGGVLEFVEHQETGLIAEPDPGALAVALERLMDDQDLCRRLGQQGRDRVKDITWDKVIERLLSAAP
ncbi:MAG: glycosyltransferase family 4 protein [Chloroflexi bacterium]|nr:glycosyltransferase family 4 protein [Chloroflexota bacterium]